jgi:hypothetical protein
MPEVRYEPLKERLRAEPVKDLIELGERKGYISISRDKGWVTYNTLGKSYSFTDPEELVRAVFMWI